MVIDGGVHHGGARNGAEISMSSGLKPVCFWMVVKRISRLLLIHVRFCDRHSMICWYVGVVASLRADLQASWFSLCLTGRMYVSILRADCEVAVKAPVMVFCALYCKGSVWLGEFCYVGFRPMGCTRLIGHMSSVRLQPLYKFSLQFVDLPPMLSLQDLLRLQCFLEPLF